MAIKKQIKTEEVVAVNKEVDCCPERKWIVIGHLVGLLILVVAAGYAYYRYANIAVVNGRKITRLEYYKTLEQQGGKQVLDGMIQEAMIVGEAEKQGVKVDQAYIEGEIAKVDNQIKAQGQTLEAALEMQGMTRADLERQIRLKKMVTEMAKPPEVTQEQINKFIADNKAQLPAKATKEELEKIAREQLGYQTSNTVINTWLSTLKSNAKIEYK